MYHLARRTVKFGVGPDSHRRLNDDVLTDPRGGRSEVVPFSIVRVSWGDHFQPQLFE